MPLARGGCNCYSCIIRGDGIARRPTKGLDRERLRDLDIIINSFKRTFPIIFIKSICQNQCIKGEQKGRSKILEGRESDYMLAVYFRGLRDALQPGRRHARRRLAHLRARGQSNPRKKGYQAAGNYKMRSRGEEMLGEGTGGAGKRRLSCPPALHRPLRPSTALLGPTTRACFVLCPPPSGPQL